MNHKSTIKVIAVDKQLGRTVVTVAIEEPEHVDRHTGQRIAKSYTTQIDTLFAGLLFDSFALKGNPSLAQLISDTLAQTVSVNTVYDL